MMSITQLASNPFGMVMNDGPANTLSDKLMTFIHMALAKKASTHHEFLP